MNEQSPKKIFGLLGAGIKHSLSPRMQMAAFGALGINAEYRLFEKGPDELEVFFKSLEKEGICGLNVTVPYKEKVIAFLDSLSDEAALIGAVNTIKISGGRKSGFNTDGAGFLAHLQDDLGFRAQGKDIIILGAGGAAKAIAVYLSKNSPKRISIFDIDRDKLSALAIQLEKKFPNLEFKGAHSAAGLDFAGCDLLVNATPVGMKEADPVIIDEKSISKNMLVYDLVYNPEETKLLSLAKNRGAKISNGLGMLLYQGMLSFEIWTGQKAPKEVMLGSLKTK